MEKSTPARPKAKPLTKAEKRAIALRENLMRRKQQQKSRKTDKKD